ncbi:MAG TPA: hypothetical protein VFC67_02695 [Prolixibacteraceae bacterium]|nr:hypothetical protein [Prolixibacteraceae bacterium]
MEETLFEPNGTPVAYLAYDDENTVYLWNGQPVAYLANDHLLYGFNGVHLGWYENGIIWDLNGYRVGFNAKTLLCYAKYEPYKLYKTYKPYKAYQSYAKYKPYYKTSKSDITLRQFLHSGSK